MQKIRPAETLKRSILLLEQRQIKEGELLREQFTVTYESLKPVNVLRKAISEMNGPSDLKDDLVQTVAGLISGYVSRKILIRSSKNPVLRMAGLFIQYGVTRFITRNSSSIKSIGLYLINKFTGHLQDNKR